jgi:hypothetical protein
VLLRSIVIEQADDAPLPAVRHFRGEPRARFAGAHHQDRLAQRRERTVEAVLLPDAVGETGPCHQEDQDDGVHHDDAARYDRLQLRHHENERNKYRAQPGRQDDALGRRGSRAPQAAVQPERQKDARLQRRIQSR